MAFGFFKKLVGVFSGKRSEPAKANKAKENRQKGRDNGGKRHHRQPQRGNNNQPKRKPNPPKNNNTAPNVVRPGGAISDREAATRKAAHAKWDLSSFVVDPIEGKRRFHDFDLPSEVMHGIAELGFKYCTEIQALSLEQALAGKNIAGKAQTGSGKTAAFLVAILTRYLRTPENRAERGGAPRALVIAPTRELVIQICKDADAIGKYTGLRSLAIYGGMDYDRQRTEVLAKAVDLLVATPGRLLDFVKSRVIDLSKVDTLVIDEADRMLDMGFIPDVRRIMSYLPAKDKRTTMLYSATLDDAVMKLAMNWMEEPYMAQVESETNATDTVKQVVYVIQAKDKFTVLYNHIALHPNSLTIVFCNRKSTTDDVYESLKVRGVSVEMLSGDVNQSKRLKVLDCFRAGEIKVVVATDVAGRGIDIKGLEYVINFDFPYEAEDYVHRIGRTGRAGETGVAISFADEYESCTIPAIEKYIKEELKCTVIGPDDPLLKPIPPRGSKLGEVDAAARASVDEREAVDARQKAAAAAVTGVAKVNLRTDAPKRTLPKFEHALDEKTPLPDESGVYSKPVKQKDVLEEWQV